MFFGKLTYDYSHAVRLPHLITDEYAKKWNLKAKPVWKGKRARSIFCAFMKLVIEDMIENGNVFISPNIDHFRLFIKEKTIDSRRMILQNGKTYTDVDLIKSDGKIYEFVLSQSKIPGKFRSVRISYTEYKKVIKKVNEGMRYAIK